METDGAGIEAHIKESLFSQREERFGHWLFRAHEICSISDMTIKETGIPGKSTRFDIMIPPRIPDTMIAHDERTAHEKTAYQPSGKPYKEIEIIRIQK